MADEPYVDFIVGTPGEVGVISFRASFPFYGDPYTICILRMVWCGKEQGTKWDGVAIKNPKDAYNTHIGRRVSAKKAIEKFASHYHDSCYSEQFNAMVKKLNKAFRHAYREKFEQSEKEDAPSPVGFIVKTDIPW